MRWHAAGLAQATVAFVAAGSLAVSGCAANRPAPRSASPRPIAVASSQAPGAPPAEPETPAGAAAFVRAYYNALNASLVSGNVGSLGLFYQASCSTCQLLPNYIRSTLQPQHLRFSGGKYLIVNVDDKAPLLGDLAFLDVRYSVTKLSVVAPNGAIVAVEAPASEVLVNVTLMFSGGWRILRIVHSAAS